MSLWVEFNFDVVEPEGFVGGIGYKGEGDIPQKWVIVLYKIRFNFQMVAHRILCVKLINFFTLVTKFRKRVRIEVVNSTVDISHQNIV